MRCGASQGTCWIASRVGRSSLTRRRLARYGWRVPQRFGIALFKPQARPATATGAKAIGALAVGAAAVGGFAIGRLSVGRLAIGRAAIGRLKIGELEVGRLRVDEDASPSTARALPKDP
jgi:hypothetical protein